MAGFETPELLILLLLIPILIIIYKKIISKKKKQAMKFSHLSYIKSALGDQKKINRNNIMYYLVLGILATLIIAISNPHIPLNQTKEGVNVILVLDVSGSMSANDYSPNRLEAAKSSAKILIESLENEDYAGIVTFESGATTAAYLSPYKETVIDKLERIEIKEGNTAIGDGLSMGIDMATSIPNKKKVVILLSDGVNNAGVITPNEAIGFANLNKVQVYTIGLGSEGQVALGRDFFGRTIYAELDEATLQSIAKNTGGKYYKSVDVNTLDEIYENISEDIEREKEETNIKDWFIVLAIILTLIYVYIRYGKKMIIS